MPIFNYKNIEVNYTSTGKGNVVVLLHGFLESVIMWKDIIPMLSKKHRIIAIDLLGHGQTENLGYVHSMSTQAEMIKALLNSLKLRKFTFIGHSMGGYIALAFAGLFPKSVNGLCLLNSTAYADSDEKKINRDRAIKVVKKNHELFVRVSIPQLFSEENRVLLQTEIEDVTKDALKTSKQGIIASLEGVKIRKNSTSILKKPTFKTLLILGKKDTVLDFEAHRKQVENTSTKLLKLSQGHMSHIEDKQKLTIVLEKFINLAKQSKKVS